MQCRTYTLYLVLVLVFSGPPYQVRSTTVSTSTAQLFYYEHLLLPQTTIPHSGTEHGTPKHGDRGKITLLHVIASPVSGPNYLEKVSWKLLPYAAKNINLQPRLRHNVIGNTVVGNRVG